MFEYLIEMLNELADYPPQQMAGYKAMVMIRDQLAANPSLSAGAAGEIAACLDINIPVDLDDEQIEALVDPLVTMINNLVDAMLEDGFHLEGIKTALKSRIAVNVE